uniref:Uncharacterized protein LOC117347592 n=1 Tax=Geotrypetes seraphini TaxID=260995 RepID=A0A6P8PIS9_GEOSA|nr:uncharacterized protein LOC117347592 [Geotrypetes seraphini]
MWAEEDSPCYIEACLKSYEEPINGKIYAMYHGTTVNAAKSIIKNGFSQSNDGMLGRGVYVSRDKEKAKRYPLDKPHESVVLKLRVNVGKVKKIDRQRHPLQKTWHDQGYDTAWVPPGCGMVPSGLEEDCVWDPRRIKVVDVIIAPEAENLIAIVPEQPTDGKIYIMFHGTTVNAAISIIENGFSQSNDGMLGRGVYVSRDIEKAKRYPLDKPHESVVLKLRVNVGKVKKIDRQRHPLQKTWHDQGYDTAWVPPGCGMVPSGLEEDCVWDPRRIKVVDVVIAPALCLPLLKFKATKDWTYLRPDETCVLQPYPLCATLIIVPSLRFKGTSSRTSNQTMWAEENSPYFIEACLESYEQPTDGKIYIMFHGTTAAAAASIVQNGFTQSNDGMLGRGVYVSRDIEKAKRYPLNNSHDNVVLKLRVNVGRVKKIDRQGHPLQKTWHDHRYDTAWVPPGCGMVSSGLEEDCVWDPNRIKVVDIIIPPKIQPQEPTRGRTYTMYHGTHLKVAKAIVRSGFNPSNDGLLGKGVYVSRNIDKAKCYPQNANDSDKVIFKLRVRVGKVKKIDCDNHPLQKTWSQHGYNTAWVPPHSNITAIKTGREEDCVWDPKRITIVDVGFCQDPNMKKELRRMIRRQRDSHSGKSCKICKKDMKATHPKLECWECKKLICPYLDKHRCRRQDGHNGHH